jgi:hypothetical protein
VILPPAPAKDYRLRTTGTEEGQGLAVGWDVLIVGLRPRKDNAARCGPEDKITDAN